MGSFFIVNQAGLGYCWLEGMPLRLADFYTKTRNARKVIVVDLGYLGDSIHLTPSLWEIKRNYPRAELHVASAPAGSELLAMVPCVDRTWPLRRSPKGTPWREQWQWLRALRREQFDVAFNFSGTDRSLFLTALSGARWRAGFEGGRRHFWNRWLIPYWVPRLERTVYMSEKRRNVLAACGLSLGPLRYELRIPPEAAAWAETRLPASAIHLSINASHGLKEWPLERWIALARGLLDDDPDAPLVATGTPNDRERARLNEFASAVNSRRLTVFAGNLTLAQLAALLNRCRLHVGADSGALHLAVVLGLPTVSLFRDYEGLGEWLPRGEAHRSVVMPCRCVNQKFQPCLAGMRPECLANIPVEQVAGLVREVWHQGSPAKNLASEREAKHS
jgi:ADP-heptose:LPS heptosyltransferase